MPTVVATVGASNANSFATVAEGDLYCDARLNASAWTDEPDDDQKARALISATRELNTLAYRGYTVTDTQALLWPRGYATDPDSPILADFDTDVVPQRVIDATCELALEYLKAGTSDPSALDPTQGVIEKTIGPLTTRWADPYTRPQTVVERYPLVEKLIKPLLIVQGNSVPLVRG
jgi:hypothetical protein